MIYAKVSEHPKKPSSYSGSILYFLGTRPLVFYSLMFHGIYDGYKNQYNSLNFAPLHNDLQNFDTGTLDYAWLSISMICESDLHVVFI